LRIRCQARREDRWACHWPPFDYGGLTAEHFHQLRLYHTVWRHDDASRHRPPSGVILKPPLDGLDDAARLSTTGSGNARQHAAST
jgi:hypothetical protein